MGYLVSGRLFHPGDAFTVPAVPVEVLAVHCGLFERLALSGTTITVVEALRPVHHGR